MMFKRIAKKIITAFSIMAVALTVLIPTNVGSFGVSAASYECTYDKLQTYIDKYEGAYWNGNYAGSTKCKGFADMMFNELYGTGPIGPYNSGYHYYIPSARGAVEVARTSHASRKDVYDIFHKARSGDYVQWSRGYSQHSAIFVSCDEEGFYLFDCNYISANHCGVHYVTFDKIARTNYGVSVYRSETMLEYNPTDEMIAEAKRIEEEEAAKPTEFAVKSFELDFEESVTPQTVGKKKDLVLWETSDNSVAVIDANGKVTGIGPGTATVTATAVDGQKISCQIIVNCSVYRITIEGFLKGFEAQLFSI